MNYFHKREIQVFIPGNNQVFILVFGTGKENIFTSSTYEFMNFTRILALVTLLLTILFQQCSSSPQAEEDMLGETDATKTTYLNPVIAVVQPGQNIYDSAVNVQLYYITDENDVQITLDSVQKGSKGVQVSMHIRGQSTRGDVTKPQYAVKVTHKKKLGGNGHFMDMKHGGKHWVFNDAGVVDQTLTRNVMAFHAQRSMGQWAPRTKYFEFFLVQDTADTDTTNYYSTRVGDVVSDPSGYYKGVYVNMEKIHVEKHRVDVGKFFLTDTTMGGFLMQLNVPEPSKYKQFPNITLTSQVELYDPKADAITENQWSHIKEWYTSDWGQDMSSLYVAYASQSGCKKIPKGGIWIPCPSNQLDTQFKTTWDRIRATTNYPSFAVYFILDELAKDPDGYHRSTFMYRTKDTSSVSPGQVHGGPLWDKNKSFGNIHQPYTGKSCIQDTAQAYYSPDGWCYCMNYLGQSPVWWNTLLLDSAFCQTVSDTWNTHHQKGQILATDSLSNYIKQQHTLLESSGALTRNNSLVSLTPGEYKVQLDSLTDYMDRRIKWMDNNLDAWLTERCGKTISQSR